MGMSRGISSFRNRPITSPDGVMTSSPGMTIRSRPRASSTASCAPAKTLWSVIAIAAEADRLGVVEEVGGRDGAVVRVIGVHVEVDDDQRPVGERLGRRRAGAPAGDDAAVDLALERVGEGRERLALRLAAGGDGLLLAPGLVLGESRHRRGDQLGLARRRRADRSSGRLPRPPRAAAGPSRRAPRRIRRRRRSRARGLRGRSHGPRFTRPRSRAGRAGVRSARGCAGRRAPSREARRARRSPPPRGPPRRGAIRARTASAPSPGLKRSVSTPSGIRRKSPGQRSCAASSTASFVAVRASTRARSFSRWRLPGGYARRSVEWKVATVSVSAVRSAR